MYSEIQTQGQKVKFFIILDESVLILCKRCNCFSLQYKKERSDSICSTSSVGQVVSHQKQLSQVLVSQKLCFNIFIFFSKKEMYSFQLQDLKLVNFGLYNGFHSYASKEYILFFFSKFLCHLLILAQFSFI